MTFYLLLVLALASGGLVAGFLAGLLGIGGGGVMVPVLYEIYGFLGIDQAIRTHLAVGTSLFIIIPVGIRSVMAHRAKGAVDETFVKNVALFIIAGVIIGGLIARMVDGWVLRACFAVVITMTATYILVSGRGGKWRFSMPYINISRAYNLFTGMASSLIGIGGGSLTTSYLTLFGKPIHEAVGTSSAIGPIIAVPGAIAYMVIGWGASGLPPFSVGYVSLLSAAIMLPVSLYCVPLGAKLAHHLSRPKLELLFVGFLYLVALRFYISLF